MRTILLPSLLPFLAAGLWFAAGSTCTAQEIKFPEKPPLVSLTLPDGWFADDESDSGPVIRDWHLSATIMFRIRLFKDAYSDADFKQKIPGLIKANLNSFGIDAVATDLGTLSVTNRLLNDKIQAVYCELRLKSTVLDEPYLVRVAGFTVDDKSMLAVCGMEVSARKAALDFNKILGSIKPAK